MSHMISKMCWHGKGAGWLQSYAQLGGFHGGLSSGILSQARDLWRGEHLSGGGDASLCLVTTPPAGANGQITPLPPSLPPPPPSPLLSHLAFREEPHLPGREAAPQVPGSQEIGGVPPSFGPDPACRFW